MRRILFLSFFFLFSPWIVRDAQAYLDPGSGSYLLQILIGTALGILISFKIYWKKIQLFLTGLIKKPSIKKDGEAQVSRKKSK